jgi:hypothetical protein
LLGTQLTVSAFVNCIGGPISYGWSLAKSTSSPQPAVCRAGMKRGSGILQRSVSVALSAAC